MASGVIYLIANSATGKYYLGSTANYRKRIRDHFRMLRDNKHHSVHLQNSWNRWGEDYFYPVLLYETDNLLAAEQRELDILRDMDWSMTYNVSPRAGGGDIISCHPEREKIQQKSAERYREYLSTLSEEEKSEKYGRPGVANSNWKGGVAKLYPVCPECGGSKGVTSKVCRDCHVAAGYKPSSKKVQIEVFGKVYESYNHASRELDVPKSTVKDRCKSDKEKFKDWRIVDATVFECTEGGSRTGPS